MRVWTVMMSKLFRQQKFYSRENPLFGEQAGSELSYTNPPSDVQMVANAVAQRGFQSTRGDWIKFWGFQ